MKISIKSGEALRILIIARILITLFITLVDLHIMETCGQFGGIV
jgi:hypothetical protein